MPLPQAGGTLVIIVTITRRIDARSLGYAAVVYEQETGASTVTRTRVVPEPGRTKPQRHVNIAIVGGRNTLGAEW